jgi:predicted nucleic acid-binding protein
VIALGHPRSVPSRVLRDCLAPEDLSFAGAQVHDARIAALCLHHGVTELWTADRDFGRFPELRTRNPLIDAAG